MRRRDLSPLLRPAWGRCAVTPRRKGCPTGFEPVLPGSQPGVLDHCTMNTMKSTSERSRTSTSFRPPGPKPGVSTVPPQTHGSALERSRTFTGLPPQPPQGCVSTISPRTRKVLLQGIEPCQPKQPVYSRSGTPVPHKEQICFPGPCLRAQPILSPSFNERLSGQQSGQCLPGPHSGHKGRSLSMSSFLGR